MQQSSLGDLGLLQIAIVLSLLHVDLDTYLRTDFASYPEVRDIFRGASVTQTTISRPSVASSAARDMGFFPRKTRDSVLEISDPADAVSRMMSVVRQLGPHPHPHPQNNDILAMLVNEEVQFGQQNNSDLNNNNNNNNNHDYDDDNNEVNSGNLHGVDSQAREAPEAEQDDLLCQPTLGESIDLQIGAALVSKDIDKTQQFPLLEDYWWHEQSPTGSGFRFPSEDQSEEAGIESSLQQIFEMLKEVGERGAHANEHDIASAQSGERRDDFHNDATETIGSAFPMFEDFPTAKDEHVAQNPAEAAETAEAADAKENSVADDVDGDDDDMTAYLEFLRQQEADDTSTFIQGVRTYSDSGDSGLEDPMLADFPKARQNDSEVQPRFSTSIFEDVDDLFDFKNVSFTTEDKFSNSSEPWNEDLEDILHVLGDSTTPPNIFPHSITRPDILPNSTTPPNIFPHSITPPDILPMNSISEVTPSDTSTLKVSSPRMSQLFKSETMREEDSFDSASDSAISTTSTTSAAKLPRGRMCFKQWNETISASGDKNDNQLGTNHEASASTSSSSGSTSFRTSFPTIKWQDADDGDKENLDGRTLDAASASDMHPSFFRTLPNTRGEWESHRTNHTYARPSSARPELCERTTPKTRGGGHSKGSLPKTAAAQETPPEMAAVDWDSEDDDSKLYNGIDDHAPLLPDGHAPLTPDGYTPLTPAEASRLISSSTRMYNQDSARARANGIHIPIYKIITMSVEEFNAVLRKVTKPQARLMRDIRRRGKNKVAAMNCRMRKMKKMDSMEDQVQSLEETNLELQRRQASLDEELTSWKQRYTDYDAILQSLREEAELRLSDDNENGLPVDDDDEDELRLGDDDDTGL